MIVLEIRAFCKLNSSSFKKVIQKLDWMLCLCLILKTVDSANSSSFVKLIRQLSDFMVSAKLFCTFTSLLQMNRKMDFKNEY